MERAIGVLGLLFSLTFSLVGCAPVEEGGMTCTPGPTITGSPSSTATAGEMYSYSPDVALVCDLLGFICTGDISLVSGPGSDNGDSYYWVPQTEDVGKTFHVTIQSSNDFCGDHAHQSWDITVVPAPPNPVIDSFTSDPVALEQSGSVTLLPVFHDGTGYIAGIGPVTSGAGVSTPVLTSSTSFTLTVTGERSLETMDLLVPVIYPPSVVSFFASPDIVTTGMSTDLRWDISGDASTIVIDPGNHLQSGMQGSMDTGSLSEDTRYTLTAQNELGRSDSASVQVRVVPAPIIDSFAASSDSAHLWSTVTLTPVFRFGTAAITGVGAVASGVPVASAPIDGSGALVLTVSNEAGMAVTASVYVTAVGPGTFSMVAGTPVYPGRFEHAAVLLEDGRVFIAGGKYYGGGVSYPPVLVTEIFDPQAGTFSAGPSLTSQRYRPAALCLNDGRVLIFGGYVDYGVPISLSSSEIYDPATGEITLIDGISGTYPYLPDAVLLGDGRALVSNPPYLEIFDPTNDTFLGAGAWARPGHQNFRLAILGDGKVLVADGDSSVESEIYDPESGSFSLTGKMVNSHSDFFSLTALDDGRALVAGGKWNSFMEAFDPTDGSYSYVGDLEDYFLGFPAIRLSDGTVLFVPGYIRTAKVFDPTDDSLKTVGKVNCGHRTPTLTTLPDGRVLVLGAGGCFGEIYHP